MQAEKLDLKKGVDFIGNTCVFFCHDGEGNILLGKRSVNCRDEHGRWDCGGGSMEFGEDFETTLRREIKEEYNVDVIEAKHVATTNVIREHDGRQTHWIATVHSVLVNPNGMKNGEPHKIDDINLFPTSQLPTPLHSQWDRHFAMVEDDINSYIK